MWSSPNATSVLVRAPWFPLSPRWLMKIRNRRLLLAGLALATLLGACAYTIKIPWTADPDCAVDCDTSSTGGRSTVLRLLLGP